MVTQDSINQTLSSTWTELKKKIIRPNEGGLISELLKERLVVFLEETTRDGAISTLVERLDEEGTLVSKERFKTALLEREKIVSTGIGIGVAVPHAKMADCKDFFMVVGLQKNHGIEWNALDGSKVKLIFMIGGPDNKQTEYLKILSCLTHAIKDEERRRRLLDCKGASEVLDLFIGC